MMRAGDSGKDALQRYLSDVAQSQPLSAERERTLASRIRQGDGNARNELVEANLRFVITMALKYQGRGVPLEDLVNVGNIGLITAAERFDGTRGFKFISYAVWWVRQSILQALKEGSRVVRLPSNRVELLRRIYRYANDQHQETSCWPDPEEIAEALDVSLDMVKDTLARGRHTVSLDATFGEDDTASLMATVADESEEPPDVALMRDSLRDEIGIALESLDGRESQIIRLYYGLGGIQPLNLAEIGVKFGLTRERIRQIKEKALRKLRSPKRSRRLIPYAGEV
ncbi:MAG: RNA polymerase sigma factor RpoD/SigA [Candidatus Latescibacteria bacterium]|jgi:RNA polymerase primary sigma factor|nr:RNA polymerase sigma factor RpoD/SigA [Candidatus Latescibacterota bacterium]